MTMNARRLSGMLATVVVASWLIGCTPTSRYMHPVAAMGPLKAPPGQAMVIFVRPSGFASGIKVMVLNQQGQFIGESLAKTHFGVALPPGRHVFISWAENTAALVADLAPDRVYHIEVAPKMGAWAARCHLLAITPRSSSWGQVGGWVNETQRTEPDLPVVQAYLAQRAADVQERVRRGLEALTKYDPAELAERTLRPEDGMASPR